MKKIKVGMMGFGTVGYGTYQALMMNSDAIERAAGVHLEIKRILVRHPEKAIEKGIDPAILTTDPCEILHDEEIQILTEVIGGIEPATSYMAEALRAGKHVVTANKAALAANGEMLQRLAMENKVMLRFEASVGGGIPIINAVADPLVSNQYDEVLGILNGTTNYILTQMTQFGKDYDAVLKDAQAKGLAEADPTADVEGIDAANKLSILISLLFSKKLLPSEIPTRGITSVAPSDIAYAEEAGYRIKLLAHAKRTEQGIECSVEPSMIPVSHPMAAVSNEYNAIFVYGNAFDELMFYGKGAGALPTGSAVLGDIIDIANCIAKGSAFDVQPLLSYDSELSYAGEGRAKYYIRMSAANEAGVMGHVAGAFAENNISLKSVFQKTDDECDSCVVPMSFVVYTTERKILDRALNTIIDNGFARNIDCVLRIQER